MWPPARGRDSPGGSGRTDRRAGCRPWRCGSPPWPAPCWGRCRWRSAAPGCGGCGCAARAPMDRGRRWGGAAAGRRPHRSSTPPALLRRAPGCSSAAGSCRRRGRSWSFAPPRRGGPAARRSGSRACPWRCPAGGPRCCATPRSRRCWRAPPPAAPAVPDRLPARSWHRSCWRRSAPGHQPWRLKLWITWIATPQICTSPHWCSSRGG